MKEGLIKNTYDTVIRELQTILSISYLVAVGIGMLFNSQKYSEFGINIFDYADILDFLIAPFSDFRVLTYSCVSIFMAFCFFRLDLFFHHRFPKTYSRLSFGLDTKSWFSPFRYSSFTLLFLFYLYGSADVYGEINARNIRSAEDIRVTYMDNEMVKREADR